MIRRVSTAIVAPKIPRQRGVRARARACGRPAAVSALRGLPRPPKGVRFVIRPPLGRIAALSLIQREPYRASVSDRVIAAPL